MNTSKYDSEIRKNIKRGQRSSAYRDLQRRAAKERGQLEIKLRERNEAIVRLTKKLLASGFNADEIAKLAA